MNHYAKPLANLINQLARLPGIGQKSAQRLAYHIAGMPEQDVHDLAAAIWQGRKAVRFCAVCGNYTQNEICDICADEARQNGQICVVRDPRDVAAMERMRERQRREINPHAAEDISALLLSMQSAGKANATCVKVYTILHSLVKMAYMSDVISINPMDKVERPKPRKSEHRDKPIEAYTASELQRIFSAIDTEPLKWRVLMRLLIDTGIRRGECCGLQWKDIDFNACTVTISGNLCYTPQKGVYLDTLKSGKVRTIDVAPEIIGLLRELRLEQSREAISPFVFTQSNSPEPMHPQSPARYMQKLSAKCGVPDLHPHKLRHTFASIAITNGADVASVSEKLGHSDKAITLRMYTHADQESIRRASQIFRDALKNSNQA